MATRCAYKVISKKWVDDMEATRAQLIVSTYLVWPIFWLIKFPCEDDEHVGDEVPSVESIVYTNRADFFRLFDMTDLQAFLCVCIGFTGYQIRHKLKHFYNAPVTKFTVSVVCAA